jgi:[amino group carrier protein]-6-phospho-L-2-aminoadipate/5-phospho-L-glutamate reductase
MIRVSVVGGSGYTGGELVRLLLRHPAVEIEQVTSESRVGEYVYQTHPNLRAQTLLQYTARDQLQSCDLLFLALPHGEAQKNIRHYATLAPRVIDLSADFRLRDANVYRKWYGEHADPTWLMNFVYGLPELHRAEMREACYISGVGCNATCSIIALLPLWRAGLIDETKPIIVDVKVGSSEGGNSPNPGSHHPERSGVIRTYAPTRHRHTAEVEQELKLSNVHMTITSVELVRGALAAAHVFVKGKLAEKDLWKAYRAVFRDEPFIRIVKDKTGVYRYPEPKILAGSNYADVGFELDAENQRVVSICAIDNLMKGAAGSAVQSMNVMSGLDERLGLEFPGLHPI